MLSTKSVGMKKIWLTHKKKLITLMVLGIIYLITIVRLGYKIPGSDKHPDWPEFPNHTNQNIVIEEIDSFNEKYGSRYRIPPPVTPSDSFSFFDYYQTNLKNIKRVDFQITENEFDDADIFNLRVGGNIVEGFEAPKTSIKNYGIEYLELNIGKNSVNFKILEVYSKSTKLIDFYQFNIPKTSTDSLFFRYSANNYMAYVK